MRWILCTWRRLRCPEIYAEGMPVSPFGRQQRLFDDDFGDRRETDGVTLLIADTLSSRRPGDLRKVLAAYNDQASSAAAGQMDIITGRIETKEEILERVNEHFRNATHKEQQALVDAAVARRTERAEAGGGAAGVDATTGEFMGIRTAGHDRLKSLKERPLLWTRGAHAESEAVATQPP